MKNINEPAVKPFPKLEAAIVNVLKAVQVKVPLKVPDVI
jgi:hypothetical protein